MQANLVPPKPFYNHSIVFKACQVKQPKHLQGISPPEVQFWPGVHYWGSPSRMFWCNGDRTPYDGKHLYPKHDLVEDLAAGELIVKAIRCSELLSSADVGAERSRRLLRSNTPAEDMLSPPWSALLTDHQPRYRRQASIPSPPRSSRCPAIVQGT